MQTRLILYAAQNICVLIWHLNEACKQISMWMLLTKSPLFDGQNGQILRLALLACEPREGSGELGNVMGFPIHPNTSGQRIVPTWFWQWHEGTVFKRASCIACIIYCVISVLKPNTSYAVTIKELITASIWITSTVQHLIHDYTHSL